MDAKPELQRVEYEYKHHNCDVGSRPKPSASTLPAADDLSASLLNQMLGDTVGRFFSGSLVWKAGSPAVSSLSSISTPSTTLTTPTTDLCSSSSPAAASPSPSTARPATATAAAHNSTSTCVPDLAPVTSSPSTCNIGHSSPLSRSSPPPPSPPVTNVQRNAPSALPSRRRKLVQSCKQLKAQVQALKAQQKAAPDRKTLESTIAQLHGEYRRAKRFIRDDAATSIQAVARGFLQRAWCRNDDKLLCRTQRIVQKQARRPQASPPAVVIHLASSPDARNSVADTGTGTGAGKGVDASDNASTVQARLEQLKAAKRHLKDQLKSFDMDFLRQHQRLPAKADKEAIRPLYEKYNDVKTLMALLEHLATEHSIGSEHGTCTNPNAHGGDSGDSSARGLRLFTDIGKGGNTAALRSQPQSPSRCRSPGQRKAALEQRLLNFTRDYQLNNGCKPRSVMDLPFAAARDYADFKELKLQIRQTPGSPAQGKENI